MKIHMLIDWVSRLQAQVTPSLRAFSASGTIGPTEGRNNNIITNAGATGAVVVKLPPAKPGMKVQAIVKVAQALRLDPNGTETVALPTGVQQAAGKYVQSATIGATISLLCITVGTWDVTAFNGAWTAEA